MKRAFLIGLMLLLMGCVSSQVVTRDQFMARANKFDKAHEGQEYTQLYRDCYSAYFLDLFNNCVPLIDDKENLDYWKCCSEGLDAFSDCMGEPRI